MENQKIHTFHIPVLGLAFSIDTPLRVSRFGISSVISIVDDILIEHMRKHYSILYGEQYSPITVRDNDYRARRITEYLNLVQRIVEKQIAAVKASAFEKGTDIVKYFEMLAEQSSLKALYRRMMQTSDTQKKLSLQDELRTNIVAGDINVNIMTKVDKPNKGKNNEQLAPEFSDALSSLRGFARSKLNSSVIFSAGLNPRLFSYIGQCSEFLPDAQGHFRKKVILKVSDYRSAYIQGKVLAKKGIWCSEFRIESGLNCGGHVFATDGYLLGPILEEFKSKKQNLLDELFDLYNTALLQKEVSVPRTALQFQITVQGGIGTANEDAFLREHYSVDGTGWGSPFLLVPDATNVDDETRTMLAAGRREDFYLSNASPLGIPFNNFRGTTSEVQIQRRVENGTPGSFCTKKFLISNTEFTEAPICTASKEYQSAKIKQLKNSGYSSDILSAKIEKVVEKACLCEDLAAPALINSNTRSRQKKRAAAVCPGPNLAYFSKIVSLEEMVGHIYGRVQLLSAEHRPNMFIQELRLYVEYLRSELQEKFETLTVKEQHYFTTFKANLLEGITYYKSLIPKLKEETERYREIMWSELLEFEQELLNIVIPYAALEPVMVASVHAR
jgi:hypothetical protein